MKVTPKKKKKNMITILASKTLDQYDYTLHDQQLQHAQSTKYLDTTIQSVLKWNCHVENITIKATHTLGLLR